ncbi:MAG: glycosyltransferase involved in cell wall biosynthesis [Verrucomicrobiales bacterium]|jgi:glycosyltransferase involved in cell wall biosynthesis
MKTNPTENSHPLVSILIPCYNSEAYLAEALDSALAQTYTNVEVIVVDDGSSDDSTEVLSSYGDRIRWKSIPNGGACAARNEALKLAKGNFIQFLDADDLLMPDKIARQLPLLLNGDYDLVFCRGTIFGDGKPERAQKREILSPENKDPFAYCLRQGLSTLAPLHSRHILDQIGGFRAGVQFAQEYDMHIRLMAAGARILFRDELLCRVRHHPSDARISQSSRPAGALLRILLELTDELMRRPHYQMTKQRCRALASLIAQHAVYAYRNGAQSLPARAFHLAQKLDPHFSVEERPWYRAAARGFGYMNIERFLSAARSVRDRVYLSN